MTSELQQFQKDAHDFAQTHIAPIAQEIDQTNQFPRKLWLKLGKQGLLGITVDKKYGGSEQGYLAQAIAMAAISRASGSIGLAYAAHSNLCANQIFRFGTEAQKQKYLPKLNSGEWLGALAMSEKDAGSDVLSMQLHAEEKIDHFVLNGHKMWITNGTTADVIVVYAKTKPEEGAHGMSC
ncbi:MAG: acyl-CoA dehydrogenase family protein, partial [Gammaproteobacteria bacterium]|nr:acyl-CoA dehydrogenase family protein [Gammaproteobacteria bacterium]